MSSFAEHVKEELTRKSFTSRGKVCKIEHVFSGATMAQKRTFLRDAFLRIGSMSDPVKAYHLEFVCESKTEADAVRKLLTDFDIRSGLIGRAGKSVVYVKSGDAIASLLRVLGAHVSLMEMENRLIYKDMRNNVNRRVNCDTANIAKTVHAAARQTEAIRYLEQTGALAQMDKTLQEAARLRLEHPEATIEALGAMMDPPLSKSGMHHRLRKLQERGQEAYGKDNIG